ncbi:MAG: hypothetical protein IPN87_17850 [Saprospiraceae bacterium]|nr:hypothetical protein [Candidatus Brachybacter algidus]
MLLCLYSSSHAPCTAVTDTIVVTVDEECDCPKLDFNQHFPLCTNAGSLDLNSLKIKAGLGGWTLTSVPADQTRLH